MAARRELRGNDLVRAAVAAGDSRTGHLAAADLTAAREAMLRREAEQVKRPAEQARRQERDRRRGPRARNT